jgi:hypothetical protein
VSEKLKIIQVKSETRLRQGFGGQVGAVDKAFVL